MTVRALTAFGADDPEPVRIAAHPDNGLHYVPGGGDVTLLDPHTGRRERVPAGGDSIVDQPKRQEVNIPSPVDARLINSPIALRDTLCLGLAGGRGRRLLIVADVQVPDPVLVDRVGLHRTRPVGGDGAPQTPALWARFTHPYGVRGVNQVA